MKKTVISKRTGMKMSFRPKISNSEEVRYQGHAGTVPPGHGYPFVLSTVVKRKFLVETLGELPVGREPKFYETVVYQTNKKTIASECGCYCMMGDQLEFKISMSAKTATKIHRKMVEKYFKL